MPQLQGAAALRVDVINIPTIIITITIIILIIMITINVKATVSTPFYYGLGDLAILQGFQALDGLGVIWIRLGACALRRGGCVCVCVIDY